MCLGMWIWRKNQKKINALSRVYRKERRLYDTEFREKERLKSKSYREKNRKLVNKRGRERNKKRKQNPEWVIKERERSRIRSDKLRKERTKMLNITIIKLINHYT